MEVFPETPCVLTAGENLGVPFSAGAIETDRIGTDVASGFLGEPPSPRLA